MLRTRLRDSVSVALLQTHAGTHAFIPFSPLSNFYRYFLFQPDTFFPFSSAIIPAYCKLSFIC